MQEENKPKKIELNDEAIAEVTKRISGGHETNAIYAKMNDLAEEAHQADSRPMQSDVIIRNLRTYQGDVAEAIKKQNASVLTITLAENRKRVKEETAEDTHESSETSKRTWSVVASIILIILGLGTVGGFYYLQQQTPVIETTPGPAPEDTIIGYNLKKGITTDGADRKELLTVLNNERKNTEVNPNQIQYIYLNKANATGLEGIATRDLFSILQTKIPPATLRSFDTQFMFGFFRDELVRSFLLVQITSYDNAYDGMLKWESSIVEDIGSLFIVLGDANDFTSGGATYAFEDETFANKDARVLKNDGGKTILLYSFLDKDTLLITSNENTLKEMINKRISQKLIR